MWFYSPKPGRVIAIDVRVGAVGLIGIEPYKVLMLGRSKLLQNAVVGRFQATGIGASS